MTTRGAGPMDLRGVSALLSDALEHEECLFASALPLPLAPRAVGSWLAYLPGVLGLGGRFRVFLDEHSSAIKSAALVYDGPRPEWVVLVLAALGGPEGAESAFRLLSDISAAAAGRGMQRVFAAVPESSHAQEPFFQAGFYSYTRETWFVSTRSPRSAPWPAAAQPTQGSDAHDLFAFYLAATPDAVRRAEQLTLEDFDAGRRAGMYDPPHLIGGNPLAMKRAASMTLRSEHAISAFALAFAGRDRHPHVLKVRTAAADVDLARDLVRGAVGALPQGSPAVSPVRSYEEHVARALLAEGFRDAGTAILFVKELAVRIEEPALAPAVVR